MFGKAWIMLYLHVYSQVGVRNSQKSQTLLLHASHSSGKINMSANMHYFREPSLGKVLVHSN